MAYRERSDTYSSLCETESDFVASERDHYPNDLIEHPNIDLENVLLKDSSRDVTELPVEIKQEELVEESSAYKHLQKNVTEEVLNQIETAMVAETEAEQSEIMENCLLILSSFIDMRILSRLGLSPLTANSLYCEIISYYICDELLNKNEVILNRLLAFANAMSSHTTFDPILCELTLPFVDTYLHLTLTDPSQIDDSIAMHQFLLICLNSVFKGSNRLFMFDLNNNQSKFVRLYSIVKRCVIERSNEYTELHKMSLADIPEETKERVMNHRVLVQVFLSDLLTILGKYFVYYESEVELLEVTKGVNTSCRLLDLQRYHRPSSILLLYTILVLSQIRSEETLIMYLNKLHQFKDTRLNFDLSVRMQSVLQRLSTAGGPLFPTADVQYAASETMDVLYPSGRWPRLFIHFLFGFLHPYYMHLWMMRQMKLSWEWFLTSFYSWLSFFVMMFKIVIHFYEDCWGMMKEKMNDKKQDTKKEE